MGKICAWKARKGRWQIAKGGGKGLIRRKRENEPKKKKHNEVLAV